MTRPCESSLLSNASESLLTRVSLWNWSSSRLLIGRSGDSSEEKLVASFSESMMFYFVESFSCVSFFKQRRMARKIVCRKSVEQIHPTIITAEVAGLNAVMIRRALPLHSSIKGYAIMPIADASMMRRIIHVRNFVRQRFVCNAILFGGGHSRAFPLETICCIT